MRLGKCGFSCLFGDNIWGLIFASDVCPWESERNTQLSIAHLDGLMNLSDRVEVFLVGYSCYRKSLPLERLDT